MPVLPPSTHGVTLAGVQGRALADVGDRGHSVAPGGHGTRPVDSRLPGRRPPLGGSLLGGWQTQQRRDFFLDLDDGFGLRVFGLEPGIFALESGNFFVFGRVDDLGPTWLRLERPELPVFA